MIRNLMAFVTFAALIIHLLYPLAADYSGFNVFRYITFRTGAATLTALFIAFIVGPPLIRKLGSLRVGQPIREEKVIIATAMQISGMMMGRAMVPS